MSTYHHEDDKMRLLYEASYRGSVETLISLIQENPLILFKISQTSFTETPLHISALLGHLDFTKELLSHNPRLALESDSSRRTALHVASAEGHVDIVKELLQMKDEACLSIDEEGRIPLHYAAMRGRTEVVRALIKAKPHTLTFHDKGNSSVFQLCVAYNQLETLKALVAAEDEFHHFLDLHHWNTILRLAVMLKQVETVRYLVSIPKIRATAVRLEKETGFTAFDVLEQSPKDFKSLEIQLMLMNSSIICTKKNPIESPPQPPPLTAPDHVPVQESVMRKILRSVGNILKHNGDYLEEMRGNLSLVATVISTITFQALVNPPGGFVQQGVHSLDKPFNCKVLEDGGTACPGDAILAIKRLSYFRNYLRYNTMCFISSLTVTLLLVSGVPLKRKVVMWMLSILMCITLTFLAITYLEGFFLVNRDGLVFASHLRMIVGSFLSWLGIIVVLITLRFLARLVNRCMKKFKLYRISRGPRKGNENI